MIASNSFPAFSQQAISQDNGDKGIRARVVVKNMFDQGNDLWPDRFAVRPQRGDSIESADGRRLSVLDVVHTMADNVPMLQVEIGVDHNNVTPSAGGGGDLL